MRLKGVLSIWVLSVAVAVAPACAVAPTANTDAVVVSGDCPREAAVVRRALDRSPLRADVDGDGRLDTVAVASRPRAEEPCRGLVAVRLSGGSTYSNHLFPRAVPIAGLEARITGLPRLGDRPGAEIVVDTRAAADALLAQMFTLADGALRRVAVPVSDDGTFIVEGGGVIYPHGAGCTSDGRIRFSQAAQTRDGTRFRVVRRTYRPSGDRLRLTDPVTERATVPVGALLARFPEFGRPHWAACTGRVRHALDGREHVVAGMVGLIPGA
jgi:hypothetical protein